MTIKALEPVKAYFSGLAGTPYDAKGAVLSGKPIVLIYPTEVDPFSVPTFLVWDDGSGMRMEDNFGNDCTSFLEAVVA